MAHDHKHNHCAHELKFCEKCDQPYCTKCKREWVDACQQNHYPAYYLGGCTRKHYPDTFGSPWITWGTQIKDGLSDGTLTTTAGAGRLTQGTANFSSQATNYCDHIE